MNESKLREELYAFYLHGDAERAKAFAEHCFPLMDARFCDGMSVTAQKLLQYDVIVEEFTPVLFRHCPYYYETGVLTALSDGARGAKGHSFTQANGWTYQRNAHLFREQDEALYQLCEAQKSELLYLICGPYNDVSQHFNFHCRPFLQIGLKGVYASAEAELAHAKTEDEKEFLHSVMHGMQALRRMAEKFARRAEELLESEKDPECQQTLSMIADTAARVPWNPPKTLYEALATLAFLRTAIGSLEGVGPNTFGRLDKDLIPFYRADIESGRITEGEAHDLIAQFLLIWDCHYDHDMMMVGYADHELENTYVLGGCDDDGLPLFNEVTALFLRATSEYNIIFPKIKCRFSKDSPKAYLDLINRPILNGTSSVLLQNDDATIPALLRAGRPLAEARDYLITGCWGIATPQEKYDHGSYLNLLKPFEFALHRLTDRMKRTALDLEFFDGSSDFEEFYARLLRNCECLLDARLAITGRGGRIFGTVDRFPIFSSTLEDCVKNHADFTMGGARYNDDYLLLFGFPNLVDSLLAVKKLVFDTKKYTLDAFLCAVRENWEGHEEMRRDALHCHGWGDGSVESCSLANRFNDDLFEIFQSRIGTYGGKVHMGYLTYTEIRFWGEKTLATPDGRRNGEYFAQGLSPSRLKRIPAVTSVVNSLATLDASKLAANSVVNIILPRGTSPERCEGFLRAVAHSSVQSLQLNCTSREELLDAQAHPERYQHLIVRVTGFSAKFTSLTREWQDEIITRNFYTQ
ncbi:MAG: hypothetical protein IJW49_01205 [Clostridia bacterium]|nr:hypothetical protein [Clostridia bacterium]